MGEVIRGGLASTMFALLPASFVTPAVWCAVSLVLAKVALDRRG
jgi:hypothetical protein